MTSQATGNTKALLAANIKAARDASGMTQRQLAAAVDVDPMLVSKWERAAHRPNDENLFALAHVLGVDVSWFYVEREPAA